MLGKENMINFECPKCAQPLKADDDLLGENIACPKCAAQVKVDRPNPKSTLRINARQMQMLAIVLGVLGFVILIAGIFTGSSLAVLVVAAVFMAGFAVLFLCAQLLFIRAALEKK